MDGKTLRVSIFLTTLVAVGAAICTLVLNFNITTGGAVFVTVVAAGMVLAFALLIFGTDVVWPVRALTPIVAAALSIIVAWAFLPSLTAPEVPQQMRLEQDALGTSFTGRVEVEGCAIVGDSTTSDVTIIGSMAYPQDNCVVEVRIDRVSLKVVPMGTVKLDELQNFPSDDFRHMRLWIPTGASAIIFVYQPGKKFYRQDAATWDRPSFTALSTRYVLDEAD